MDTGKKNGETNVCAESSERSGVGEAESNVIKKQLELREAIETWIAETGETFTPWAPHVSSAHLKNCKVLQSRYHLLDALPKGGKCIELGTQAGDFAREILVRTQPSEFHVVDPSIEKKFKTHLFSEDLSSNLLKIHEGDTSTVLSTFPDNYFDWIYISGDHSYDGVKKDLTVATKKVKTDGLIACSDYTNWSPGEVHSYGVVYAVNELCQDQDWEFVYFALQGQGYHNVCIRKV